MDSPANPTGIPSFVPTVPGLNQSHADSIISSLLSFPDSSPISISSTFDRVLDDALASASGDVSVQDSLVDRTLKLASLLLDSTKRCFRKRASLHNSNSWFLPPELTIKFFETLHSSSALLNPSVTTIYESGIFRFLDLSQVFSMLDTKSLMQAAACCTMFNNCAMDRLSYAHIDLTTATKQTDNGVVNTMIHRAGKELRSIKLGSVTRSTGSDSSPTLVPGPLLAPLSYNHGFLGSRLRSLQLYNLRQENYNSFIVVLSVCPNIIDLRIVGLCTPFMQLFTTLAKKCRLLEHMCLETYGLPGAIDFKTGSPLLEFVTNSSKLTSLTLIGFRLTEEMARKLVESCRKLKYLNLSRSPTIKGRFLRDLGYSCKDSPLETIILRNCHCLQEKEVSELCNSILKGNFKSIRHIDVSNNRGLDIDFGDRSYKPKFPLEKLKEERPDVTFVADFPLKRSEKRYRVCAGLDEEELRLIEMMEAENEDESEDDDDSYDEVDSDEEILL